MSAPFAWGCSAEAPAGQAAVPIAIVDAGFHNVLDLQGNVGSIHEFAQAGDSAQHGTAVAGIVGAVGGNNTGITGMLWHAQLNLHDINGFALGLSGGLPGDPTRTLELWAYNAQRAVENGSRIVNFSWALSDLSYSNPARPGTRADSLVVKRWKANMRPIFEANRDPATGKLKTLFVVAAGNSSSSSNNDSYWGGWGAIKRDFPEYANNIIIVGAVYSNTPGELEYAPSSNAGPYVDLVAPGADITSLGKSGTIVVSGTSFATPFVTGIAGMLMSFDPTLAPDSVKQLILAGARVHPRDVYDITDRARPKPFPDAYQSLKLAAQRTGAPLCGNRVYARGSKLVADRSQGAEVLGTLPAGSLQINARHGGHRVEVSTSTATYSYTLTNGRWVSASTSIYPNPSPTDGGSYNSSQKFTHDADSLVEVRMNGDQLVFAKYDTATYTRVQVGQGSTLAPRASNLSRDCDYLTDSGQCLTHNYLRGGAVNRTDPVYVAVPLDNGALLAIGYFSFRETSTDVGYYDCKPVSYTTFDRCRDTRSYATSYDSLQVFQADPKTGLFSQRISRIGPSQPQELVMSEDGSEIILRVTEIPDGDTWTERTTSNTGVVTSRQNGARSCVTLSYAISPTGAASNPTELVRVPGDDGCAGTGTAFRAPTFSPYRAARSTPIRP